MAYTTINKPSDYFNTLLYSGNDTAQRQLTGVGFQPDLVWIKGRSGTYANGYAHFVFDGVRGVGKQIHTNLTNAESTNLNNLYSFDNDGFSLGQSGVDAVTNGPSTEYVAWNWLASNTTASNTDGTITSTVSANTTAGFSIATYTGNQSSGATFGHGLGTTPSCFIIKCTSTADIWVVYHKSLGGGDNYLRLNTTGATSTGDNVFASTAPSSSLITLGDVTSTNYSGRTYVCYSFAEKKGFSKFGSYVGNGSTDGTFVYTGFKPAFVLVKNTQTTVNSWEIHDNKRDTFNVGTKRLYPNADASEGSGTYIDMLSNGFKWRSTDGGHNSANTFIYMAFAENPIVTSTKLPATAR